VQTDPHANRAGHERFGQLRGGSESGGRSRECDEERVALRIHLHPAVAGASFPYGAPVPCERLGIRLRSKLVQELRGALDVREEEGDGAGWEVLLHGAIIRRGASCVYSNARLRREDAALATVRDCPTSGRRLFPQRLFPGGFSVPGDNLLCDRAVTANPLPARAFGPPGSPKVLQGGLHIDDRRRPFMEVSCEAEELRLGLRAESRVLERIPALA
jgi:hypothetical protein